MDNPTGTTVRVEFLADFFSPDFVRVAFCVPQIDVIAEIGRGREFRGARSGSIQFRKELLSVAGCIFGGALMPLSVESSGEIIFSLSLSCHGNFAGENLLVKMC